MHAIIKLFWRFTRWHITPRGAAFSRVYGQPHERLFSLPVGVLFRVGSAKKNQPRGQRLDVAIPSIFVYMRSSMVAHIRVERFAVRRRTAA